MRIGASLGSSPEAAILGAILSQCMCFVTADSAQLAAKVAVPSYHRMQQVAVIQSCVTLWIHDIKIICTAV